MQGLDRIGEQAGGDEENEQAGEAKELAQVQPYTAGIEAIAHRDGDDQPQQGAQGRTGASALLKDGEQEEHGFQALARDGQEHHADQGIDLVA